MSTADLPLAPAAAPLRQDAQLMGLVGAAHLVSHFSQLLLAPLFPWLKHAFQVSYTQLGFLMTVFFVVSCVVQTSSGFLVDKHGPRSILFVGLGLLAVAAMGFASSTSYGMLAFFAVVAGIGNGVFHPVDYTLLNRKISITRLGHAYSVHGITGSLGWALAPALLVPLALAFSWRVALWGASAVSVAVWLLLWVNREKLTLPPAQTDASTDANTASVGAAAAGQGLDFLRIPAVWLCFAFFFFYAMVISVVQAFAPEAARHLNGVPLALVAACLTAYMVCSAGGMVLGGFLASNPLRCERIVGVSFGLAALMALTLALVRLPVMAVPVVFAAMGFASGIAGPSRDLLVKAATPANASGRVYGVVYSGLDIGQAVTPLIFGALMDHGQYTGVLLGLAAVQMCLIGSAFNVRKGRKNKP